MKKNVFETGIDIPTSAHKEEIQFKKSDLILPVYANTVFGSPNPDGTFTLHFTVETTDYPEKIKRTVIDGQITDEIFEPQNQKYVRHVVSSVILNRQLAHDLSDFLRSFNLD